VDACGRSAAWLHLDAGDRDPATFIYFLRTLVPASARDSLPVLTPEHADRLEGFSHLFFRALFAALPTGCLVVLDNVQDAMCADVALMLREGCAEVPPTHSLVLISRERLPAIFARHRLSGALQVLDADELKFTVDEATDLAERLGVDRARAVELREKVDGWAAGLFVALSGAAAVLPGNLDDDALFEYFAGEVYDRATVAEREVLLATCVLPDFTPTIAAELSGISDAPAILARLYAAQCFLARTDAREPAFKFHPLFRDFLIGRLRSEKSREELGALRRLAAQALVRCGRNEEAIGLLLLAAEYGGAADEIRSVAPSLVEFGRGNVLLAWLSALPPGQVDADPWLTYWQGAAILWSNPDEAYQRVERAYELFERRADRDGQLASTVTAMDAIESSLADFQRKERWLDRLESLLFVSEWEPAGEQTALRGWCSFLFSAMDRRPDHPRLAYAVTELVQSVNRLSVPLDLRLAVLNALLFYGYSALDEKLCDRVITLRDSLQHFGARSPSTLCAWHQALGWYYFVRGGWVSAIAEFDRMAVVAAEAGIENMQRTAQASAGLMHVLAGHVEHAATEFDRLEKALLPQHHFALRMVTKGRALLHARRGSLTKAVAGIDAAVRSADELGIADIRACTRIDMAEVCLRTGQFDRARQLVEEAAGCVEGTHHKYLSAAICAFRVMTSTSGTNPPKRGDIVRCMEILEQPGVLGSLLVMRSVASFLCNWAIEYGVREHVALDLIRDAGLEPPDDASERWPWPVRIRAFGAFEMSFSGVSFTKDRRLPQKVMELLKLLVGGGAREHYVDALADALWPDSDGADAKGSFHTTLHRLRRLLGNDRVVPLSSGKLALNAALCWTDVRTFEQQADLLLASGHRFGEREQGLALSVLRGYRGQLMPGDDHPSILGSRDRLHAKYLKLTFRLADTFGSDQRWNEGVLLLERALEIDPGNEPLLARLSRQLQQAGREDEVALLRDGAVGRDKGPK